MMVVHGQGPDPAPSRRMHLAKLRRPRLLAAAMAQAGARGHLTRFSATYMATWPRERLADYLADGPGGGPAG